MKIITKALVIERQRDCIALFCNGKKPPLKLFKPDDSSLTFLQLQDWVGNNLSKAWDFSMNISILDAAEAIATSQIENGYEAYENDP